MSATTASVVRVAALAGALAAALGTSCGDSDGNTAESGGARVEPATERGDERRIERTVTSIQEAYAAGDGAGVCSRLTSKAQQGVEQSAGGDSSCAQVIATLSRRTRMGNAVRPARVVSVRVNGDTATGIIK